ncbi:MAG TPA: DNA-binding response regulator, partial [Streptosporangiaceae bacterium]
MADDQTSTVRGDAELIARAGHLFDAVHEEFVCAARDMATWSQPEARSAVARRVRAPGADNFAVRKLWSPLALADEAQRAHLLRLDA